MRFSQTQLAEFFSIGEFESTFPYLSEHIVWEIVGENSFHGKEKVKEKCKQITAYFNLVETNFAKTDVIINKNKIVIRGTAEFKKEGNKLNYISACEVYEFNDSNQVDKIISYCIPIQK